MKLIQLPIRSASRVSNRDRTISGGSTPSSLGGSLSRINSVTSVLKRIFSREDRPDGGNTSGTKVSGRIPSSCSAASLQIRQPGKYTIKESRVNAMMKYIYNLHNWHVTHRNVIAGASGSMRIGVIEEVDEQLTLTSLRHMNEKKPHVQSIFAPQGAPPPSNPVDIPGAPSRIRQVFSRSAPARGGVLTAAPGSGSARESRIRLTKDGFAKLRTI